MAEVRLKAIKREDTGKGSARKARAAGRVPGILYGRGMQPVPLAVDRREFVTALHTDAGINVLLDIDLDGQTTLALTRDLQRDPVKGTLLHADFLAIDRKTEIDVEVPVHLTGEPAGVKEGGVLEHPLFSVHLKCLPGAVPESIEVDVAALAIGDSLRVGDLPKSGDYEIVTDAETVVASVVAPISEAELEELEAGAGVVTEPGAAADEAATSGEAAPEGAGTDEPTSDEG
ncbi:MAG TPA: 50S ribosomal protein L25/general stress protein Ctc [Actinomycetota bacterium]|jgi:large subunit ribosomal protein L25|nr:50S ribosomal protein L25/general stress protein Ctc [Actinomycetota bacterium]